MTTSVSLWHWSQRDAHLFAGLEWRSHEPKTYRRLTITRSFRLPLEMSQYHCIKKIPNITQLTDNMVGHESLFVGCLTSQQHASVSQGRICSDNFTCCHTEIEVADQTFYLTQSQYTDTRPTSPSAYPITPGAWQSSHWSANFWVTGMTRPRKNPGASVIRTQDLSLSRWPPKLLGHLGGRSWEITYREHQTAHLSCELTSYMRLIY